MASTIDPDVRLASTRILVSLGTRPEAIKLAPVIHACRERPGVEVIVVNVGQHAEMLDETLAALDVRPQHDLAVIRPGQSLPDLTARALRRIAEVIEETEPDLVVAQGDTTTVLVTFLAAFYAQVPGAHVEAGLRTGRIDQPFPEEMNRRIAGALAALHFAPTEAARANLLREGVDPSSILVTGNTVIDAVRWMAERAEPPVALKPLIDDPRRMIVVTAHRRESWGMPMERIADALTRLAAEPDVHIVFPIHPNPVVRRSIVPRVEALDNVTIIEPLPYPAFVSLMQASYLLLTDSGGIQEEAAALRRPVLVMRDVTERGEGVETGTSIMVGRDVDRIVDTARELLGDDDQYRRRADAPNPYGDGHAAERIVDRILEHVRAGR